MTPLTPVGLNLDASLTDQQALGSRLTATLDLRDHGDRVRLSCGAADAERLADRLRLFRAAEARPLLTFIGSGDFHHVSLLLLQALPPQPEPVTLVLVDHHPDWFNERPPNHCGNWVWSALRLPHVRAARLVGQDSNDLRGHRFRRAPFDALCDGAVVLRPRRITRRRVPLRWPRNARTTDGRNFAMRWWGTSLHFEPAEHLEEALGQVAAELAGRPIYLSIDKDCLRPADAATDWEQGDYALEDAARGVRRLAERCELFGADVCGDRAPTALAGVRKRLDAGRLRVRPHDPAAAAALNQRANLALLDALTVVPAGGTA
jgi:arginase family enzyme